MIILCLFFCMNLAAPPVPLPKAPPSLVCIREVWLYNCVPDKKYPASRAVMIFPDLHVSRKDWTGSQCFSQKILLEGQSDTWRLFLGAIFLGKGTTDNNWLKSCQMQMSGCQILVQRSGMKAPCMSKEQDKLLTHTWHSQWLRVCNAL